MRVFINEDWCHFIWTRENQEIGEKNLKDFIYQYKNTSITDFLFNVNGTVSTSPSKVLDTFIDKYLRKEEHGIAVDYTNTLAKRAYDIYVNKNLDMYSIWIETCKEIGINPWLSIRMNDIHLNMKDAEVRKSIMVEDFKNEWTSAHREVLGYFDKCLDYSKERVRNMMFNYIVEQANMYDVYGIELDFTREPFCFPCGKEEEGEEIIIDFVRKVRLALDEIGKKRNTKIRLSILGQANPISALKSGFDISTIAKEGLIDLYVASPRWETVNTDIPIEIWKNLLPENVMFGCSQGLIMRPSRYGVQMICDLAMDLGQAVANAHRGSDIIYLYNHFDVRENIIDCFSHENDIRQDKNLRFIYENIGKIENYESWERRIPVSYDDFVAVSEAISFKLPISTKVAQFRIPCGKILNEQKIYINVVLKEHVNPENINVYVNTKKAKFRADIQEKIVWTEGFNYTFEVSVKTNKTLGVEVVNQNPTTIYYIDALIPKTK